MWAPAPISRSPGGLLTLLASCIDALNRERANLVKARAEGLDLRFG
jgi:hypothetical protein